MKGSRDGVVILDSHPLTPVEVEQQIREVSDRIEEGTEIAHKRHQNLLESERLLKREKAERFFVHRQAGMSIKDAEYQVTLDTDPARQERDLAQVKYTYARDLLRSLENRLRGLQTQAAGLRTAYPMAGRGISG